ncbi:uncharacterized protein [Clytia hemisphaerica]|uniref:uncharacterized protein n=1 Tax=Clytia hemisphaerica TaxID=252671 RepID=UPI0034D3C77B
MDIGEMYESLYNTDFVENQSNERIDFEDSHMSVEDKRFMSIMEEKTKMEDGHYVLPLPLRDGESNLPNNRRVAERRLASLKRKLERNPTFFDHYMTFMDTILKNGHARIAKPLPDDKQVWYLPHHGVYHPRKPEKVRVVLDCGAEFQNQSLNKQLLTGPDLTNQIVGVLSRFRQGRIGVMADIQAMFYQVFVPEHQRSFFASFGGKTTI